MASWKRLTKPRFIFVYPLVALCFWQARTTERLLLIGIVLIAAGELLRLWANGYVGHVKVNHTEHQSGGQKIGRLTTAGPYAYVRNPLYLGTFLIGAGFCAIVGNPLLPVAALAAFAFIYDRKMREEEATLAHEAGADYLAYQAAVPRIIPYRLPRRGGEGSWSWRGLVASKEWKTLIWVTVTVVAMYFREEIIQEHEVAMSALSVKQAALLGFAALLIAIDGVFEVIRRTARAARGQLIASS